MKKRIGSFYMTQSVIENGNEDGLYEFFSNFIILEANFAREYNAIQYIAISKLFDEIERAHVPPRYNINTIKTLNEKTKEYEISYRAQKIDVTNFNFSDERKYIKKFNEETQAEELTEKDYNVKTQAYPALKEFLT